MMPCALLISSPSALAGSISLLHCHNFSLPNSKRYILSPLAHTSLLLSHPSTSFAPQATQARLLSSHCPVRSAHEASAAASWPPQVIICAPRTRTQRAHINLDRLGSPSSLLHRITRWTLQAFINLSPRLAPQQSYKTRAGTRLHTSYHLLAWCRRLHSSTSTSNIYIHIQSCRLPSSRITRPQAQQHPRAVQAPRPQSRCQHLHRLLRFAAAALPCLLWSRLVSASLSSGRLHSTHMLIRTQHGLRSRLQAASSCIICSTPRQQARLRLTHVMTRAKHNWS